MWRWELVFYIDGTALGMSPPERFLDCDECLAHYMECREMALMTVELNGGVPGELHLIWEADQNARLN